MRRWLAGLVAWLSLIAAPSVRAEMPYLRVDTEQAGQLIDAVETRGVVFLSFHRVGATPAQVGTFRILRWHYAAGKLPEAIQGSWEGQEKPWNLRKMDDGRVLAFTADGCVTLLSLPEAVRLP